MADCNPAAKSGSPAVRQGQLADEQAAIAAARPPFAITHAPGRMLVTNLKSAQLAAI